jgi:ribosome biogenesis GTPase
MKGETEHDKVAEQVLVANVDTAVLVCAAGYDWNPRRIERYLALVADSGAEAVLLVSKADLADSVEALTEEGRALAPGITVLAVSSKTGSGIEALTELLVPGKTAALLGSSGSGKSSLLNALSGRSLERVHAVRADDHRGRHTTSRRSLYRLPTGALVIDTPGLREVQLWVDSEDIDAVFPEIESLSGSCRFRDCSHQTEPGCAVLAALERGEIEAQRLSSWRRLHDELDTLRTRRMLVQKWARRAEAVRWRQETRYGTLGT